MKGCVIANHQHLIDGCDSRQQLGAGIKRLVLWDNYMRFTLCAHTVRAKWRYQSVRSVRFIMFTYGKIQPFDTVGVIFREQL